MQRTKNNKNNDVAPEVDGDELMKDYTQSMIFQNADGSIFDEIDDGTEDGSPQTIIHDED